MTPAIKNNGWLPAAFADTAPGVYTADEADASRGERRRAVYDFLRQLLTLDAAALVLVTTLTDRIFSQPIHRAAIGVSVVAFLISLTCAGFTYLNLLAHYPIVGGPRVATSDRRAHEATMAATFLGFVVGMAALAWYFVANWVR